MLFDPVNFKCQHKRLLQSKLSKGKYKCEQCSKIFIVIPTKNDPITLPNIINPPNPPEYPGLPRNPDYIRPF